MSLERLGDFLAQRGQPGDADQALAHHTRGLEIREQLRERNPGSAQAARDVSLILDRLGDFLAQRGQPGDAGQALAHYTRALAIREQLHERNPDSAQAARDVSVSLLRLGDFLARRRQPGDTDQALAHFTRSLEINETLREQNPDSAQAARDVSLSLLRLGDFLARRGQPGDADQALAHDTRGLAIQEKLLEQNPDSALAASDVSASLQRLGDFLAQRGQPGDADQALAHFTRSLEISERLLEQNPDSAQAARNVSAGLSLLGDFLAQRGQPGDADQALAHFTRGLEIREQLREQNPDSAQAARDVSMSLYRLGDFLAQRGRPGDADQALTHFTRCLEILEQLREQNPDSAQAARDVSVGLQRLGDFLAQRGRPGDADQALGHYTRSLESCEQLREQNPGSAQAARDVMVSQYELGELDLRLQNYTAAATHFTAGIATLDRMIERGLNAESSKREREILEDRRKFCQHAEVATGDWDKLLQADAATLPRLLSLRVTELSKRGRLPDVAQAGAKLRELEPATKGNLYNAACAYGLCASLVTKDKPDPTAAEQQEIQRFIGLSLDCLKAAIAAGWDDFDHIRQDADLAALRGRPEFEALIPKAKPE